MEKLYVVFIEGKGFISTFNKITNEYTTSLDYKVMDYSSELKDAESIARFFGGKVFTVDFES